MCKETVFTAIVFVVLKAWEKPECPSVRTDGINSGIVYSHNGILFNQKKKRDGSLNKI